MKLADSKLARQPQALWPRRVLFQLHLWTGIGFGLYVLLASLTGSAIVFRHEMDHALCPRIIMVKPSGPRMSDEQLVQAARNTALRPFARFNLRVQVRGSRVPGAAVEVWYLGRRGRFERLFDPYTGKDLGDAVACEPVFVSRLADLHDNLLAGDTGLAINGTGAVLLVLMCLSGAVIWWPGTARWRRSLTVHRHVGWRRFVWDLHSMIGFWTFALLFMWAFSGIYFAFPNSFYDVGDFLVAHGAARGILDKLDVFIDWLVTLHFGRGFGFWIKVLWSVLGLVPAALIVTGALMWWNRVLRRAIRRAGEVLEAPPATPDASSAPLITEGQ
ncbi:MAG TPA: PepSY-associated TM helix domain-containing protein [Steroidobacteraceae bacterium]|jgi:uncharacterized iron-regulated membrane protein|nr:PepSY-associated TM helix domain-containing protein [Steroidobacteraceae bacterium]